MERIKFEKMPPFRLEAALEENSVIYLPIGSMEWHGPHMGMGMDTENAYEVAKRTAARTGGTVYPPLYIGTESLRTPETLHKLGFKGNERIMGMDFPGNSIKSMYWPPDLFEAVIRQHIEFLCRMGYKKIVLMNGHGADRQIEILERLSGEYTERGPARVITILTLFEGCKTGLGHAGLAETAIMQAVYPDGVELDTLPPKPERLYNTQFAIVDSETFVNGPNEDGSVRYDPRDATAQLGQQLIEYAVQTCAAIVSAETEKLK